MYVVVLAALALSSSAWALRLEGTASYKAVGQCFTPRGGVPLAGAQVPKLFDRHRRRVTGNAPLVIEYDRQTGACTFAIGDAGSVAPVFQGECMDHPAGQPYPLAPVQDPKRRFELLPMIVQDRIGFGSVHGYLVYPEGALLLSDGTRPNGFSGRFLYTTTFVPPSNAVWGAKWHPDPKRGPTTDRCVYSGIIRLGNVPIY